ncbi:MAG: SIMPL domain-containing protein [Desulfobacterales bacterium]|nr:SIMPL domain-containing protein [Desulfobacterales bacterium]
MKDSLFSLGITLMIGLIVAGYLISDGIKAVKLANRYVTVKGLSEKTVQATMAAWNISFTSHGDTFESAISKNKTDQEMLVKYLKDAGLPDKDIEVGTPRVQQDHYIKEGKSIAQYQIQHSILIKSKDVALVKSITGRSSEILQLGIALSGWDAPNYYFTQLNTIKPDMIAQATVNARKAAEKFAQDSQSKVGNIRKARQGPFSFHGVARGMSETQQIEKVVRVVITTDYFLID